MTGYLLRRLLAGGPNTVRHHRDQLRGGAIRAGRPGRADDRGAEGQGRDGGADHRRGRRRDVRAEIRQAAIAARAGSTRTWSRTSRRCSASTSRRSNASRRWCRNYLHFDFGRSFFRGETVVQLILQKMPVSISIGLWSTLLVYLVSIPLGIAKAVRDGTPVRRREQRRGAGRLCHPGLPVRDPARRAVRGRQLRAVVPAARPDQRGVGSNWSFGARVLDYGWHMVLPTIALVAGGFASLTMLTKNCFLEEIRKQYVVTARAKGASEQRVAVRPCVPQRHAADRRRLPRGLHRHTVLLGAAGRDHLLAWTDLACSGFESAIRRDYPVMFGTLYIFTLLGLLMQIVGDIMYTVVDPRIDFEARG